MAIIDSAGLFLGDRLGWCSDAAQLHWPRLYSAANNFARLELNYRKILSKAYANFRMPPAEQEFWAMIREYKDNFLLLVYQTDDGVLWGQWQTNERYLLGHKNADDRRSPAPPLDAQDAYRNAYLDRKKSKSSTNVGLADLLGVVPTCSESCDLPVLTVAGVGVGVGGGEGVGGGKDLSVATQPHPVATLGAKTKHPDLLIYEAYPRKEGKRVALKAIGNAVKRLVKGEEPLAPMPKLEAQRWLFAHTLAYARSPSGQNPDKSKIPHPSTWFNQSRYDDDQANWQHTGATNGKPTRIDTIAESSRAALALLDGVDNGSNRNVRSLDSGGAPRSIFESPHDPPLAQNPGRDR